MKIKVGLIGFGRMGQKYFDAMSKSELWEIKYICDKSSYAQDLAKKMSPTSIVVSDEDVIFNDPEVQVVGLYTLANSRLGQIEKAVRTGKHIMSEKPVADTLENERKVVDLVEHYDKFSTVNLYLRNSWYHQAMKEFIEEGELGELAIVRICHMTPGLAPGEGHEYEGPAFHDCGMHYVDIARWYAESEYKTFDAQAIRMWDYKDPWWLQAHGTFENGIVFDITQGFVYGQLSKVQTHNSYADLIGTKGIVRMTHDFKMARVELRGVNKTLCIEKPFGEKNIDKLCQRMAESILSGKRDPKLPEFRDSMIASEFAWKCLENSRQNDLPSIGNEQTLIEIRDRRKHMTNGYGLLRPYKKTI